MPFTNLFRNFKQTVLMFFAMLILALPRCYAQSEHATVESFQKKEISTIQIQNFNVIIKSGKVFIKWTQAPLETDCILSIERSENGSDFFEISSKKGFVSNFSLFYSFIDENPNSFVSYYKIKQTDLNGDISYSEIKQVENQDKYSKSNINLSTASLN